MLSYLDLSILPSYWYFYSRLIQQVVRGCSKTETAFSTALCISIHVNLIIQEFSHLNRPLAYFTIVISWYFLLRRKLRGWRNRPFGLISQKHPLRTCFRQRTQMLVQRNFIFLSFFLWSQFLQVEKLLKDSDIRAVPMQNGSLRRDVPSIGTLVDLPLLLCQRKLATIKQLMCSKPMTRLGSLPSHRSSGRPKKLLLESMAPQHQLCHELRFRVLVGHFPPLMISVQQ